MLSNIDHTFGRVLFSGEYCIKSLMFFILRSNGNGEWGSTNLQRQIESLSEAVCFSNFALNLLMPVIEYSTHLCFGKVKVTHLYDDSLIINSKLFLKIELLFTKLHAKYLDSIFVFKLFAWCPRSCIRLIQSYLGQLVYFTFIYMKLFILFHSKSIYFASLSSVNLLLFTVTFKIQKDKKFKSF